MSDRRRAMMWGFHHAVSEANATSTPASPGRIWPERFQDDKRGPPPSIGAR